MLVQRSIADDLLYKYQAVMMYLNGGLLPNGALEFAAIRPEIYNCLDEINDAMSGVVGGDFVNNLRRAVYGKFIYLKNYPDYHRDSASFNRRCGIGAVRQPILTSSIIIDSRLNR